VAAVVHSVTASGGIYYPARQKAASFNLDEVMQKRQEDGGSK
jgi:hypothetical protein